MLTVLVSYEIPMPIFLLVFIIPAFNILGWGKPQIIVTLILSIVVAIAFFFVERKVPDPAVPPHTWSTPNIIPLFIHCLRYSSLV